MLVHFVPVRKLLVTILAIVHKAIREMDALNVLDQSWLVAKLFVAYVALVELQFLVESTVLLQDVIWRN